jgi:hypothetical protein
MSKYQLVGTGWSIGSVLVPVGSVIDTVAGTDDYSKLVVARGLSPPISAMPLDQATYAQMQTLYAGPRLRDNNPALVIEEDYVRWIVTGPGVVR